MEIVTIEKKAFELWKQRFENFVGRVDALCVPLRRKRDKWLDNCETCRLLNFSARTMQTYRDTGKLPYSQISSHLSRFLRKGTQSASTRPTKFSNLCFQSSKVFFSIVTISITYIFILVNTPFFFTGANI